MTVRKVIQIEVVSDILCPWCWIGKRGLEQAIQETKNEYEISVKWLPFLLRPNFPEEGVLKTDPPEQRVGKHLKSAGEKVGINFTGKCDRSPNTTKAHCLLQYCEERKGLATQNDIQEKIFQAYFSDGYFPGNDIVLLDILKEANFTEKELQEVEAYINDQKNRNNIHEFASYNSFKGVSSVPFFIMNGTPMLTGGQPKENFIEAFKMAPTKHKNWPWTSSFEKKI